ncbi:hypothetical protein E2320_019176, partial [Naja naja]
MYQMWKANRMDCDISEQRLMDQRRVILSHKFFTATELREIEKKVMNGLSIPTMKMIILKNKLQKKEGKKLLKLVKIKSKKKNLRQGQLKNKQIKSTLAARYGLENKEIAVVIEELKQRVVATAEKIKKYENRLIQFQQNS